MVVTNRFHCIIPETMPMSLWNLYFWYLFVILGKKQWRSYLPTQKHIFSKSRRWHELSNVTCILHLSLQWRDNGRDGVSNHQPHDCVLNRLFGHRSKKTSKLHVTGLCAGNSQVTDDFPTQMASNPENVSIWWRHHVDILIAYQVISRYILVKFYDAGFERLVHFSFSRILEFFIKLSPGTSYAY